MSLMYERNQTSDKLVDKIRAYGTHCTGIIPEPNITPDRVIRPRIIGDNLPWYHRNQPDKTAGFVPTFQAYKKTPFRLMQNKGREFSSVESAKH